MRALKYAFRRLAKAPLFTAIALVTLALGIGVNTAVFSIMDGFLLRTLPYPQPDRIAALVVHREGAGATGGCLLYTSSSFTILDASLLPLVAT